ncbi:head decoration protein [Sporomusa sp.]|uniref:head decoration protein n=1 Tax=Sporomusa sp. TaxID=2078658 RepID=UPI002BF1BE23|nr:head decoration protein [Sporomusa sp.]HWR07759.1 head decoration protein [Sporomusa sp.]
MAELVRDINEFEYDGLIGGVQPALFTKNVIIASGAGNLARGTVLGQITANKKYQTADSASEDGSQVAKAVLAYPVDATNADVVGTVYWSGSFDREKLIFGGADTAAAHEDALRDVNIILTSAQ